MRTVLFHKEILFLVFGFLITPFFTFAQQPCGNIIGPENWIDDDSITTTPIENCADPFGVTQNVVSPYTLKIEGNVVDPDSTIEVPESGVTSYEIEGNPTLFGYNSFLFIHDNNDYRYINTDPSRPVESDYRTFAQKFFAEGTDIEPFISAALDSELYFSMDYDTQYLFSDFMNYVDENYVPQTPALLPGTYTYVIREYDIYVSQNTFLEKLFAHIIPTAYAQSYPEYVFAITFTLVEAPPKSAGISDILFLPGIQASRLYTKIDGDEEKLWEPFGNGDVQHLRMTDSGESIEDVYTKEIVDEIYESSIAGSVYKKFVQHLIDIDEPSGGPLVTTFPYDWRQDVFDIVENGTKNERGTMSNPITIAKTLAELSPTKKITLIAHSNGGLLAKAILLKLQEEGLSNIVDKVIFIATPHIGTPKALATLLHGYDQQHLGGLIVDDVVIRDVMKNMPGVYGLLPSESYVTSLTEPLVSFDDSSVTEALRNAYGFTLSNMDEYTKFLKGEEGRVYDLNRVNEPSTANQSLLANAFSEHKEKLDSWTPPDGVQVYNIVGTGLVTPKSIEYRGFDEVSCAGTVCVPIKKIEPVVKFTNYGDETVVSKSATLNENNIYVKMKPESKFNHSNITEFNSTQLVIDHILHGSSTDGIDDVSNSQDIYDDIYDVLVIHSPVHLYIKDSFGRITGKDTGEDSRKIEIPRSSYVEIGGAKYVVVPTNLDYSVFIEGEGSGKFTLTIDSLKGDSQESKHSFVASTTSTTVATFDKIGNDFSIVSIDIDGDKKIDKTISVDGELIEAIVSYQDLSVAIRNLNLKKNLDKIFLVLIGQAERVSHKGNAQAILLQKIYLVTIQRSIRVLENRNIINHQEFQHIDDLINKLVKQIV